MSILSSTGVGIKRELSHEVLLFMGYTELECEIPANAKKIYSKPFICPESWKMENLHYTVVLQHNDVYVSNNRLVRTCEDLLNHEKEVYNLGKLYKL